MDINSGFHQGKHKGENRPLEEGTPRAPVRWVRLPPIEINTLGLPKLIVRDKYRIDYPPYEIVRYGPHDKGKIYRIKILVPKDMSAISNSILSFFNDPPKEYPFSNNPNLRFNDWIGHPLSLESLPIRDLSEAIDSIDEKEVLYVILHTDNLSEDEYWNIKLQGFKTGSRTQFINISHVVGFNPFTIFNLWVQMLAKCNGTPWKVDLPSNSESLGTNSLIIGISFSKDSNGKYNFGIVHYLDLINQVQIIEALPLRKKDPENLVLDKDEISKIIENGIKWHEKNSAPLKTGSLDIYVYKTTQLYRPEEEAILEFIQKNESVKNITHVHVKQSGPVARIYNLENQSYYNNIGQHLIISSFNSSDGTFSYRGKLIIGLSGRDKNGKVPLGTPVPKSLNIYSTKSDALKLVANQLMIMKTIDWGTTNIKSSKIPILKYSRRVAEASSYIDLKSIPKLDIRDLI
jgi:hypothetical protein